MIHMVKVEGSLDEMYELFGDNRAMAKKFKRMPNKKKPKSTVKRPLNAWQKFVKTNSSKYKLKSGKRKGQINLKAMSRDFKRGKKK